MSPWTRQCQQILVWSIVGGPETMIGSADPPHRKASRRTPPAAGAVAMTPAGLLVPALHP
jgi:hypothetical protein